MLEIIGLLLALGIIGAFTHILSGNDNKRLPEKVSYSFSNMGNLNKKSKC